ncbi:HAMP domain-containing protein [Rhodopirellula sp. MGV]|uniref:HAMP domain-containing protein n=1 Tax=Rhodopirellula sp. MGV TaxID=2023130 RepID=UPI000B96564F|nr:HAMP domain-containing protein [Rhodopirellula sp. MGV]OYP38130.1 hypothetical protein CGZ80_02530 [Rhodopirellula sp. MGV]PNY38468.1 hypothetical protein C2E31_00585 [Rhodopirellula baltica]
MNFLRRLTQSTNGKLFALTAVFGIGFLAFGTLALSTLNVAKVHGPHYDRVVQNKDLLADVLPPPNYIVESYLTAHLLTNAKSARQIDELVVHYESLKQKYEDRQQFWRENLSEGDLKKEINELSRVPAETFFSIVDEQLIPAVKAGEFDSAKTILEQELAPLYNAHRASIDKIVVTTNQNAAFTEAEVRDLINDRLSLMWIVGLCLAVSVSTFAIWMSLAVVRQENEKQLAVEERGEMAAQIRQQKDSDLIRAESMQQRVDVVLSLVDRVANGNLDVQFPDLGNDGIGQVAEALNVAVDSLRHTYKHDPINTSAKGTSSHKTPQSETPELETSGS